MAIEKRKLPTGEEVGFNTVTGYYCPLPKNYTAPPENKPLEEMSEDELKALADSKGIKYHWNAGANKLIELLTEAEV